MTTKENSDQEGTSSNLSSSEVLLEEGQVIRSEDGEGGAGAGGGDEGGAGAGGGDEGGAGAGGGDEGGGDEGSGAGGGEPEPEPEPAYTFSLLPKDAVRTLVRIGGVDYRLGCGVPSEVANSEFAKKKVVKQPKMKDGKVQVDEKGAVLTEEVSYVTDIGALPFNVFFIDRYGPRGDHGSPEGFIRIVCVPKPKSDFAAKGKVGEEGFKEASYLIVDEPISANSRLGRQCFLLSEQGFIELMININPIWLQKQFKWTDEYMVSVLKAYEESQTQAEAG